MEAIEILEEVEIILGRDTATQEVFVVYGRERLDEILRDPDSEPVDLLMIKVDRRSDELNQVLALVQIAKNRLDTVECE